jgi:ABC-type sugar transport system ATPase subunit
VRLRLRGARNEVLSGVDLDIHAGEIVGVAGLQGSGRTELARAIFGADPLDSGTLELDGRERTIRSPRQAVSAGIGFVTEDRKAEGLALEQSVRDNVSLAWRALTRSFRREHTLSVSDLVKAVELRFRSLGQEVRFLSGGNQQKVVLAKWLATEPRLVIFDEPTRGIDVGAKAGIHDLIRGLAKEGVAVLMISSELPEVIGMSDRIIVMRHGGIAGELAAGPSEAEIMFLATGERDIAVEEPAEEPAVEPAS